MIIDVSKIHMINSKPIILPDQKNMVPFEQFIQSRMTPNIVSKNHMYQKYNFYNKEISDQQVIEQIFSNCGQTTFLMVIAIHIMMAEKRVIFADATHGRLDILNNKFDKLFAYNNLNFSLRGKLSICGEYQVEFRERFVFPDFIIVDNVVSSIRTSRFDKEINLFNCPKVLKIK